MCTRNYSTPSGKVKRLFSAAPLVGVGLFEQELSEGSEEGMGRMDGVRRKIVGVAPGRDFGFQRSKSNLRVN